MFILYVLLSVSAERMNQERPCYIFSQPPQPLLTVMRGFDPLPRPLPFQGEGCNRSYSSLLTG